MAKIMASVYQNKKEEKRVRIMLDRADAVKLVKGDETTKEEFDTVLTAALKG